MVNNNAAEVADLRERIGAKVGQSDSALAGLQAALGAQQAEIAALKLQIGSIGGQQPSGSSGSGDCKKVFSVLDIKVSSGLEIARRFEFCYLDKSFSQCY